MGSQWLSLNKGQLVVALRTILCKLHCDASTAWEREFGAATAALFLGAVSLPPCVRAPDWISDIPLGIMPYPLASTRPRVLIMHFLRLDRRVAGGPGREFRAIGSGPR